MYRKRDKGKRFIGSNGRYACPLSRAYLFSTPLRIVDNGRSWIAVRIVKETLERKLPCRRAPRSLLFRNINKSDEWRRPIGKKLIVFMFPGMDIQEEL